MLQQDSSLRCIATVLPEANACLIDTTTMMLLYDSLNDDSSRLGYGSVSIKDRL
jgi:hypothetical protein